MQDGCIHSLPLLLQSYCPNLDGLPVFVMRLATEVLYTFLYQGDFIYRYPCINPNICFMVQIYYLNEDTMVIELNTWFLACNV